MIQIDRTFAQLLSNFCLDIAKAAFIAGFITPQFFSTASLWLALLILTKMILAVIVFLWLSWKLARYK